MYAARTGPNCSRLYHLAQSTPKRIHAGDAAPPAVATPTASPPAIPVAVTPMAVSMRWRAGARSQTPAMHRSPAPPAAATRTTQAAGAPAMHRPPVPPAAATCTMQTAGAPGVHRPPVSPTTATRTMQGVGARAKTPMHWLLVHPRHGVERVAHPRPRFRPRASIVERLGRKVHAIEHDPGTLPPPPRQQKTTSSPPVGIMTDRGRTCTRGVYCCRTSAFGTACW